MNTKKTMSPAELVIERFDGVCALARLLGKNPSTISRWKTPREDGGTGGLVPSQSQPILLALAKELGVQLSPTELLTGVPDVGASGPAIPAT